jgi:5-methylcytosine-specific restriction protein A
LPERLRGRRGIAQRKRRLNRTNGLCERCLGEGRWTKLGFTRVSIATVVNHIIPLILGGSDDDDNTENLCADCDRIVTAEQFGHKLKQKIGRDGWPL